MQMGARRGCRCGSRRASERRVVLEWKRCFRAGMGSVSFQVGR